MRMMVLENFGELEFGVEMKIKVEVEIDTDNADDLNTIEELIEILKELAARMK